MSKTTLIGLILPLLLLFSSFEARSRNPATKNSPNNQPQNGTLQKMIVQNGSVTMNLDLNRLNGLNSESFREQGASTLQRFNDLTTIQFAVAANSFFSILVFNDLLRGPEQGSMALIAQSQNLSGFPAALSASINHLVVEKLASTDAVDLAVRDSNTGFTFFNIEGHQYDYDANAQLLRITGGRLLVSKQFAKSLGRSSDTGAIVGRISIGATMQAIEINQLDANGDVKSARWPAQTRPDPGTVPGPDVIVGNLIGLQQSDSGAVNGFVGLALGTDACNKGTIDVDWFALPSNDHPFIPQNLYRMSAGGYGDFNTLEFEQIGQSWGKHAFAAASSNSCNFGCNGVSGSHLGSGCSDAYGAGLNGSQTGIGSRAWVNPFTGSFPGSTANDHTGHVHDVTSHRILVQTNDLIPAQNVGATYFAEAQYVVPHEYTWCQSHPGQCNMYNNASYQQQSVTGGPTNFSFSAIGSTIREQPAIMAWTGATVNRLEPDPGNDGIWFIGYKAFRVSPTEQVWHYEYALYNENLDRAIQSFSVPIGPGVNVSSIGFHAPPQHPGFAHDGTCNDQGYSSTPWTVTKTTDSITWNTETFQQNCNANAIRFGTLYNFRFDADQPPNPTNSTVGFFKTGAPMPVVIQAPGNVPQPSPTPTPTASPTPTFTPTPTPTPIPCNGLTITQISGSIVPGTTDTGNHGDDTVTTLALPFPVALYGQSFTSVNLSSNGNAQFMTSDSAFGNVCLPWTDHNYTIFPYWDDLRTDQQSGCASYPGGTCGIYTSVTGTAPNRIFNIEWRAVYFSPSTDQANFELRVYENANSFFEVIYGTVAQGNNNATAGVQRDNTCFNQYFCNGSGGPATGGWTLAQVGTPTPTPTATVTATATPTSTRTPTPTASPTPSIFDTPTATPTSPPCSNYTTSTTTGNTITPGSTDTGNHCDDCSTAITLPFPVSVYGQSFTGANVSSNGSLDLIGTQSPFTHGCLVLPNAGFDMAVFPYQDDLRTDNLSWPGCSAFPGSTCGIFTSTTGTAPNRQFNIEWRATHFSDTTTSANFEVVFYEGQSSFFDIFYGATSDSGSDETSGVQASNAGPATTFSCGVATLTNGLKVRYSCTGGASPTPTATATPTSTRTPTPTASPTPSLFESPTATVTPTSTPTATHTPTATPTPTCSPGGSPGPWTFAASVEDEHYGGFMDSDGTFAYEGGGYAFYKSDNIDEFGKFDPVANSWTPLAPVPDLNNCMASGVYAPNVNKLFVFGGERVSTATVVDTTRIYDIATNTWSTGAPMPDVRAFMASGYYNGKIYLVGGYSTGSYVTAFLQTWEYDPVANTFATKTSIPASAGFGGAGSGVVNGHLYVAGGRDANNTMLATTWDYDIAADTWTARANLPAGVNVPGSAVIGGKLWIFGGGSPYAGSGTVPTSVNKGSRPWSNRLLQPDTTDALELYDPATNTWSNGPSLNHPRSYPASTHVGNTAIVVGGYCVCNPYITNSVEINVTGGGCASPTPTATATATPTTTATATATTTATATATATAIATPTSTPTTTPRPTPTARPSPGPRVRPTPPPRPA